MLWGCLILTGHRPNVELSLGLEKTSCPEQGVGEQTKPSQTGNFSLAGSKCPLPNETLLAFSGVIVG